MARQVVWIIWGLISVASDALDWGDILLNKDSDLGIENQRDNEGEMRKNVTFGLSGFLLGGKVEEYFEGDEEEDKEEEVIDEDHEV